MKFIQRVINSLDSVDGNTTYYILVPYSILLKCLSQISVCMFVLYFLSFNFFMLAVLVPLYVYCIYIHYIFLRCTRRYGWRLIRVLSVVLFVNIVLIFAVNVLREAFLQFFFFIY